MNKFISNGRSFFSKIRLHHLIYLGSLFLVAFFIFIDSQNAEAAPPQVVITDSAPYYMNQSSDPVCVLELTLTDDDGANLSTINITVENITALFDPNVDLAPLTGDNTSGITIYQESNFQIGFQLNDTPLGMAPTGWAGGGPWQTSFYGINHTLPNSTSGPNYYVVIRTSVLSGDGDMFRVGIEAFGISTNQGQIPLIPNWSKAITIDTLIPQGVISVTSQNPFIKYGDWMNITVSIAGDDAVFVTVNLTEFNGLSGAEPMSYDGGSKLWFYNITFLMEGFVETGMIGYYFEVFAQDKVGKNAVSYNFTKPIDTIIPTLSVMVYQESVPGGIGSWINITVSTDPDVADVTGDLSAFSGLGISEAFNGNQSSWWCNFTVQNGSLDGIGTMNITVVDDAGNTKYDSNGSADVDEVRPQLIVSITQEATPAGIGNWINITVFADSDVTAVNVDLASAGFSGQVDNQALIWSGSFWYYQFNITSGSFDGTNQVNVDAADDAGNLGGNSTQSASWDEVAPSVTIQVSDIYITDPDVGGTFEVYIYFNETMDNFSTPVILFNPDIIGSGTLTFVNGSWSLDKKWYNVTYAISDKNETHIGINVSISGARDDALNTQSPNPSVSVNAFDVDTLNPTVASITLSDDLINEADVFGTLTVIVEYAQAMNTSTNPTLTFAPDVVALGTLVFLNSEWIDYTHYIANYTIFDADEKQQNVDITISGAKSLSGSVQAPYTKIAALEIDTEAPIVISVNVSHQIIKEVDIGDTFWVNCSFSEAMNTSIIPLISFDPDVIAGGVLNFLWGVWNIDGDWYNASYNIVSVSQTFLGINVSVNGTRDISGNFQAINASIFYSKFDIIPSLPTVTNVDVSDALITDSDVNGILSIKIEFSEAMNIFVNPSITFMPDLIGSGVLIPSGSFWLDTGRYIANYTVVDSNERYPSINITVIGGEDQFGNPQIQFTDTLTLVIDLENPVIQVTIIQGSTPAAIGDWVNITVTTHADVTSVMGNLSVFSGEGGNQVLNGAGANWYYNFTIKPGQLDGLGAIRVDIVDDAGNTAFSDNMTLNVDEVAPQPFEVKVLTGASGSNPAKIGDWINITVDMGAHMDVIFMFVIAPGIFDSVPITLHYGDVWYLNTTVIEGSSDGLVTFTVHVRDDANNTDSTKYDTVNIDNIYPVPLNFSVTTAHNSSKTGEWINMTIDLGIHSDIASISVEAPGVFSSMTITESIDNIWFLNTTILQGSASGEVTFTVTVTDDAGNTVTTSAYKVIDNQKPIPVAGPSDGGISFGLLILLGCIGAVSVCGVVMATTEIGHYSIFFFFYLLYTRIKKEYVLDNFTRGRIYGYIEANPGEHFNAIKRALGLKNGSLAYHLRTLEKSELVMSRRDRGYTRFYPKAMKLPQRNIRELIPIQRNIMNIVDSEPGISQRKIAEKMKISFQLVHYHIKVLQESEYLILEKDHRQTYCYNAGDYSEASERIEAGGP